MKRYKAVLKEKTLTKPEYEKRLTQELDFHNKQTGDLDENNIKDIAKSLSSESDIINYVVKRDKVNRNIAIKNLADDLYTIFVRFYDYSKKYLH